MPAAQRATQRYLPADCTRLEPLARDLPARAQEANREGKVEARTRLADPCGREIRRQPLQGELEAGVQQGRADALACLAHRGVGQSHDREDREARPHVDLDRHLLAVDALYCECRDACEHATKLRESVLHVGCKSYNSATTV
jgi:hypothetical protein